MIIAMNATCRLGKSPTRLRSIFMLIITYSFSTQMGTDIGTDRSKHSDYAM